MTDHPMSVGQELLVWRMVNGKPVPCRVQDLQVGDHHRIEGMPEVFVLTKAPVFSGGHWTGEAITAAEYERYCAGEIKLTRNGAPFDLAEAIARASS